MRRRGVGYDERLRVLSAKGNALERLNGIVDLKLFRPNAMRCVTPLV